MKMMDVCSKRLLSTGWAAFGAVLISTTFACVPQHLQKYRSGDPRTDDPMKPKTAAVVSEGPVGVQKLPPLEPSAVQAVDERTYRFSMRDDDVWDAALNVLLHNYNLTIVDKDSGVISTEWDTFFRERLVYRNKVTLRVRRLNYRMVEVVIHNATERLQDGTQAGTVGAVWMPTTDDGRETSRIVRNMAVALGQNPPAAAQKMVTKDVLDDKAPAKQ